jgi:hypothetical protein
MKETDIQNTILEYLQIKKIYCWRNNNTSMYDPTKKVFRAMPKHSIKGVSDILGILPNGKLLAIEVKKKGTYPSKEQKEFIQHINDNGGVAFVARSIEDVDKLFD